MLKQLLRWFGNGLLFLIPVGGTVFLVAALFRMIDDFVREPLQEKLGLSVAMGVGVLITFGVVLLVGIFTSLFITRPITRLIDTVFGRMPFVKLLYNALKDLISAFVGDTKKFDKPVLVELIPGSRVRALGFITRESLDFFGMADDMAVYFPQSYNFAGSVLIVPKSQIQRLELDSSDVMTFIVSGGVSGSHVPKGKV